MTMKLDRRLISRVVAGRHPDLGPASANRQPLDMDGFKDALDNALRHMRQPRTKLQRQIVGAVAQLEAGLLDWAKRREL